jgi:hypothetical protein
MNDEAVLEEEYRGRKVHFLPTDDGSVIPHYKMFIDKKYVKTCSLAEGRRDYIVMIDNLEHQLFVNRSS